MSIALAAICVASFAFAVGVLAGAWCQRLDDRRKAVVAEHRRWSS